MVSGYFNTRFFHLILPKGKSSILFELFSCWLYDVLLSISLFFNVSIVNIRILALSSVISLVIKGVFPPFKLSICLIDFPVVLQTGDVFKEENSWTRAHKNSINSSYVPEIAALEEGNNVFLLFGSWPTNSFVPDPIVVVKNINWEMWWMVSSTPFDAFLRQCIPQSMLHRLTG